jgi:nucleoside-diphosphate-sugar epimerase
MEERMTQTLPEHVETVAQLDELLSRPSERLVEFFKALEGDIILIGASGKVGPTVARMAQRAVKASGRRRRVIGVARSAMDELAAEGVETIRCDLMDMAAVDKLPKAENVVFLAGRKFGSTGSEAMTWATNVMVPYHVARAFTASRVAAFSTGCVYPVVSLATGGSREFDPPEPVGEYAMSCLGRERMFDYFSETHGERVVHLRLNYAVEMRYGVLFDVATRIWNGQPVDITTGYANVIWQGDVGNQTLLSLGLASSPARILNMTGPEIISIRQVAEQFGRLLGRPVTFAGTENGRGYLNNAREANELFGHPSVSVDRLIEWTAHWIRIGGKGLGKPTHFEAQDGKY